MSGAQAASANGSESSQRASQRAFCVAALPDGDDLSELRELLRTAGVEVVGEMVQRRGSDLRPVGFLDDAPQKHGLIIQGLPVLGGVDQVAAIKTLPWAEAVRTGRVHFLDEGPHEGYIDLIRRQSIVPPPLMRRVTEKPNRRAAGTSTSFETA